MVPDIGTLDTPYLGSWDPESPIPLNKGTHLKLHGDPSYDKVCIYIHT